MQQAPIAIIPGLMFYDALVSNSIEELKRCVELHKIDLNARLTHVRKRSHTGLCPVHLVASKGYFKMLLYLIQSGCNVQQATCTLKRRAVHYAALRHQVSCLQILVNQGANLDAKDTFGNTPLHYAAEEGDYALLRLLISNGASLDAQDITHKTPLMKAARNGKIWAVRKLLASEASVNMKEKYEETALHYAARQGFAEITSMLIKAGARVNAQNQTGYTPLMEAVSYNQSEVVALLVRQKAVDLYKRDFISGDTTLHIAVKKNYAHIVEILLNAGNWYIEYNFNTLGESFVYDIIVYNRLDLLRLLLAYNYDFELPAKRTQLFTSPSHAPLASAASSAVDDAQAEHDEQQAPAHMEEEEQPQPTCTAHQLSPVGPKMITSAVAAQQSKLPFQLAWEKGHVEMCRILSDVCCVSMRSPGLNLTPPTAALSARTPLGKRCAALDEVKSLKLWCRRAIRQLLGFDLVDELPKLQLPGQLKDFLLLADIQWSVAGGYGSAAVGDQAVLVRSSPNSSARPSQDVARLLHNLQRL